MAQSAKEKLATLNRRFRPIEIVSQDGEQTETLYYRRPTETEDGVLRKMMEEHFESVRDGLKTGADGKTSAYEMFRNAYLREKPEVSVDTIISDRIDEIGRKTRLDAGLKEYPEDGTEEEKAAWKDAFEKHYDAVVQEFREPWLGTDIDVLAVKAAESKVSRIAQERAIEVYRRALIQQSLYSKDEAQGTYELIFAETDEVPDFLDKDTIDMLANRIMEEMNRFRNVPLK